MGAANETQAVRLAVGSLARRHAGAQLDVLDVADEDAPEPPGAEPEGARLLRAQRLALAAALPRLPRDSLLLLLAPHAEYNQDFLNRVSHASLQTDLGHC